MINIMQEMSTKSGMFIYIYIYIYMIVIVIQYIILDTKIIIL